MKWLFFFASFLFVAKASAQTAPVSVQFDKTSVQQGDSLHFTVWANSNELLEVTLLSNDFLALQQNVQVAYSELPFHLSTADYPTGKYFILVTGNGIHIEKEFLLWKPE